MNDTFLLVRFREHVLISHGDANRATRARARRAAVVERFFAQPNVPGAGVERLAIQLVPGKGALHVARFGAHLRSATPAIPPSIAVPAQRVTDGADCLPFLN